MRWGPNALLNSMSCSYHVLHFVFTILEKDTGNGSLELANICHISQTCLLLVKLKTLYSKCFFHIIFSSHMGPFNKLDK